MRTYAESIMKPDAKIGIYDLEVSDELVQYARDAYNAKYYVDHFSYQADGKLHVNHEFRHSHSIKAPDDGSEQLIRKMAREYFIENFYADEKTDVLEFASQEIIAYPPGVGIRKHIDDSVFLNGSRIAADFQRCITTILYLNDEFEGGEIYFDQQDTAIRPVRGTFIMFPSNRSFTHEVKPITSGLRLSYQRIFTVWHGDTLIVGDDDETIPMIATFQPQSGAFQSSCCPTERAVEPFQKA